MSNATMTKPEAPATTVETVRSGPTFKPAVDIMETEKSLLLVADVPGAAPDGIEIDFEKGTLTIRASVANRGPREGSRLLLNEYGVGDFLRTFQVGDSIDAGNITASVNAGVLTVELPKAKAAQKRKISVRTA